MIAPKDHAGRDGEQVPPSSKDRHTASGWLRTLFVLDIVGAGGCGLLLLLAPDRANEWLFDGTLTPDGGTTVLACVWIALGLLSVAGTFRPVVFSPILLVQFLYKLLWLGMIGVPALAAGRAIPPVLTVIFALWVVAVGIVLPWRRLFASDRSDPHPVIRESLAPRHRLDQNAAARIFAMRADVRRTASSPPSSTF